MRSYLKFSLICALVCAGLHGASRAEVPLLIHYQGQVEGADSPLSINFSLHPGESSAERLWSETQTLTPDRGRFSVLLGSQTPLDPAIFNANEVFLSLSIGDQELSPRQQVVSVAYALQAANADDVAGAGITPKSVSLSSIQASWDTAGTLSTPIIQVDSVIVGSTPVIDSSGSWVGPSSTSGGLTLRSVSQTTISDDVIFFLSANWKILSEFETRIDLSSDSKLDISFSGQLSSRSSFETRLSITEVSPNSQFLGQIGNTSGGTSADTDRGASLHNQAYVELPQGTYRLFVEHRSGAAAQATLKSASLIIRRYE